MKNSNKITFKELERKYKTFRSQIPRRIALSAENFFKRNFQAQGFVDKPFKKWKPRKNLRDKGRAILVKSGKLRRSIKSLKISENTVIVGIGDHIPYAELHNKGGKILITPKMRRFFWAKYKEADGGLKFERNSLGKVILNQSQANLKLSEDAQMWKAMALTKKQYISIPKRQFIGNNKALAITLDRMITQSLKKYLQ